MSISFRGVMQSPVTPLKADFSPDLLRVPREFHRIFHGERAHVD